MTSKTREIIQLRGNVRPDPAQGFPGAELSVSYALEKPKDKIVAKVIAMYFTLTGRAGPVAKTRSFDDGAVVVDFNRAGDTLGIELLTASTKTLAEFRAFYDASKDMMFRAAANTLAQGWPKCEVLANATLEHSRAMRKAKGLPPREALEDLDEETDTVREFRDQLKPEIERVVGAA